LGNVFVVKQLCVRTVSSFLRKPNKLVALHSHSPNKPKPAKLAHRLCLPISRLIKIKRRDSGFFSVWTERRTYFRQFPSEIHFTLSQFPVRRNRLVATMESDSRPPLFCLISSSLRALCLNISRS
jgi:hypothetical protein